MDQIIYPINRGIVIKLYFIDITISPFNRLITDLVNPHPGHGIPNKLRIKHILNP